MSPWNVWIKKKKEKGKHWNENADNKSKPMPHYKFSLSTSYVKDITDYLDVYALCHWGGTN